MTNKQQLPPPAAGNGLLDRRGFLRMGAAAGAALLGAASATAGEASATTSSKSATASNAAERKPWMRSPGRGMSGYGQPAGHEAGVMRVGIGSQPGTPGSGASRTPLEQINGTITPSGLHFERHHSGIPDIDPEQHQLLIHGLVKRPLVFDMAALDRYPMISRLQFLECSGNSGVMIAPSPPQRTCGELHGLVSASEWTGIPLAALLEEAQPHPDAAWIVAEGADAAMMSRSVPLAKATDDAMLALYQNGERLRPENGYPLRLFLPGWEGNMSVKWLHRIKVTRVPAMSKDETSKYTDLQADGSALQFTFPMAVKSVITSPAPGLAMAQAGHYQVTGLAWSGAGRIRRVEVSADGGASWADAALDDPVLPRHLTRFRTAWRWDGQPALLLSRATDETGARQPTRAALLQTRARSNFYHYNAIQAWRVADDGGISNAYV